MITLLLVLPLTAIIGLLIINGLPALCALLPAQRAGLPNSVAAELGLDHARGRAAVALDDIAIIALLAEAGL